MDVTLAVVWYLSIVTLRWQFFLGRLITTINGESALIKLHCIIAIFCKNLDKTMSSEFKQTYLIHHYQHLDLT